MLKMSIHPVIQAAVVLAYLYVAWLGLQRLASQHLRKKARFNWQRHVRLGTVVMVVALLGAAGGLIVAKSFWYRYLATGLHGVLGLIAAGLVLVGLVTGVYMNWKKRPRRVLPLVHGLNNLVLLGLIVALVITGLEEYGEVWEQLAKTL